MHVLAEKPAREGIDDPDVASVPLHTNRTANPARRRVVSGIDFDAAVQMTDRLPCS